MSIFDFLKKKETPVAEERPQPRRVRNFDSANTSRLFATWTTQPTSADNDIRRSLKTLVARSRDLAQNSDYVSRYLRLVVSGVLGSTGMKLQCRAMDPNGRPDVVANRIIERAFYDWSMKYASYDSRQTLHEIAEIVVESTARDGEVLVRMIKDTSNPYGLSLQLLESDHLDVEYTEESNNIYMGIKYDYRMKPVSYFLYDKHPGNYAFADYSYRRRVEIPASEILHIFRKSRPSQTRGIPWITPVMSRIKNLVAYQEAEIIHKRIAASKMGFFTPSMGDEYLGDYEQDGDIYINVEPGQFEQLSPGMEFTPFDVASTGTNFNDYVKRELQGIASGLNVGYHSLASDYDSASYSAGRLETIDERDYFKTLQAFFIHSFYSQVFSRWLEMALTTGALAPLPLDKYDKFNAPAFLARTWDWVDPQKDANARVTELRSGLTTITRALAEKGLDFEEVVDQIAAEQEYIIQKGVALPGLYDTISGMVFEDDKSDYRL